MLRNLEIGFEEAATPSISGERDTLFEYRGLYPATYASVDPRMLGTTTSGCKLSPNIVELEEKPDGESGEVPSGSSWEQ